MSKRRFAGGDADNGTVTSIRNVCLAGHVDHGKSSFADSLLAANNIISSRLAGKIRYLDSREDEQERGITMESSAVSLSYRTMRQTEEGPVEKDFMINLIDTPGHVDFSSEVDTASRLCDGVLIIVDAVEGVCTQTVNVLRQAWTERLTPLLVINKMDRLITELKLSPIEAHHHLMQLVEQVNAVMGSFFASERLEDDLRWREDREKRLARKREQKEDFLVASAPALSSNEPSTADEAEDESNTYQERDDEDLYFAPETGNVIFASAIDGWAFRIGQFAHLHAVRLHIREARLTKVLWGDFYLDPKTKRVITRKSLGKRNLKPLFVQLILENLWAVYDSVILHNDTEKVTKIITALGVKVKPQELKSKDTRSLLTSICSQWLPLAPATFRAIIEQIPGPADAQRQRIPKMLHPELLHYNVAPDPVNKLERDLFAANSAADAHVVAYISKMFAIPSRELPHNQRRQLTAEEMRERGRILRAAGTTADSNSVAELAPPSDGRRPLIKQEEITGETLIGFARLYSGVVRVGQPLYCVSPRYTTSLSPLHASNTKQLAVCRLTALYMLMGRELVAVDEVPAGNVFGACGLEDAVPRNATLCAPGGSEVPQMDRIEAHRTSFVNLAEFRIIAAPIVRVALEPVEPSDMPKLVEGLDLLTQADPCVETFVQDTGEHVILTAGELHLERCIRDLRERFAKIDIQVSAPIVPFRESAVDAPDLPPPRLGDRLRGTAVASVLNDLVKVTFRAVPLPPAVVVFLNANDATLRRLYGDRKAQEAETSATLEGVASTFGAFGAGLTKEDFWAQLDDKFQHYGSWWQGLASKIWSFGPRRIGANLLLDSLPGNLRSIYPSVATRSLAATAAHEPARNTRAFDESIETAFQLATLRGPLCAEPLSGMAFFVESVDVTCDEETLRSRLSQITGGLIAAGQDAFKAAMLDWSPRILLAMYSCDIQASSDVLGKVYGVVSRRRGRIIAEEMKEGTSFFTIGARLPVVESFGFADDIRTRTSGAASPQLIFSGFEILDQDPYWVPTTEEELEDLGEKADRENTAKKYIDAVRKRKGMAVERKIVEHAEKQRTLKRG